MSNLFINRGVRFLSSREQARLIRDEALSILEKVNEFSSTSRRVGKRAAYKVISRSLHRSKGLPFSIRKHQALSELSDYISLAKHNKVNGLTAFNTDLLPVSHPRSTKLTTMTASAMLEAQMYWVIDDPQITDESVKSLLASAMMSHPDSPEHIYSLKRIELLPQGTVPLEALVAAYGDGNSRAARRARALLQRRDRKGRFAEMFGTFKLILGLRDGGKASATGRILGQNIFSPDILDMELPDGRIAAVPIRQGEQPKASLDGKYIDDLSPEAREKGYVRASDLDIDPNAPTVSEDSITFMDAPSGFREDKEHRGLGKKYTDETFDVTVFDGPSPQTRDLIDDAIKRSREIGFEDPKQLKLGEDGKSWDPDRKLFAVNRRGEKTKFAFAQNWKDTLEEIRRKEKLDDKEQFEPLKDEDNEEDTALDKQLTQKKFSYKVPEGSIDLNPKEKYVPEGKEDDPTMLSKVHRTDELQDALVDALEPVEKGKPAVGLGRLTNSDGEEFEVPAQALLNAIDEQGEDSELTLAKAYDQINGNTENEDALRESRFERKKEKAKTKKPKELEEAFDEVTETESDKKPIAEISDEDKTEADAEQRAQDLETIENIPALAGLSKEEKNSLLDNQDYLPYIPKNEDIDFPEGMYKPKESSTEDKQDAYILAATKQYGDDDLIKGLNDAIKNNGSSDVQVVDENEELVPEPVSAESWRDALALRGKDANKILKDIADGSLDLEKESKDADKEERKKLKKAQDKSNKEKNNLEKALGVEGSEYARELTRPFQLAGNVDEANTGSRNNRDEILESAKTYLEGKDLNNIEDVKAGISELLKAFKDSKDPDDSNYNEVIETINEELNKSLNNLNEQDDTKEETPIPSDQSEIKEAPSAKDLLDEEEALADKFEQEGMTRSDAQGAASAETKRKYGKTSDEALAELPREEALKILNERDKKETPAEKPKKKSRKKKAELPEGAGDGDKSTEPVSTDEQPPKRIVKYRRKGNKTLLRPGKGGNFRQDDLKILLNNFGFDWSDPDKSEVADQTDKEFKEFGRFISAEPYNIDFQPADGQEPIDFDAPTPEIKPVGKPEPVAELPEKIDPVGEIPEPEIIEVEEEEKKQEAPSPGAPPPPPNLSPGFLQSLLRAIREGRVNGQSFPRNILTEDEANFIEELMGKKVLDQEKMVLDAMEQLGIEPEPIPDLEPSELDEDEDDTGLIDEAILETVKDKNSKPTVDELIEKVKNREKLTRKEKRILKKEKNRRKDMMMRIVIAEFGPKALLPDFPARSAVRQMLFELDEISTEEMEDIGRLINSELGWNWVKNLRKTTESINSKVKNKSPEELDERPGAENYVFPPLEEKEEEKPAEKPLPLSAKSKEVLKALVDRRRKIQRKIDKADLSETATPAQKKALKDELDEITKIIDEIVLGEKPAESVDTPETPETPVSPTPSEEAPEVKTIPASSLVKKMKVRSSELKPGDIIVGDHFVITDVKPEGTKKVNVEGVTQDVPAYRISGYFPGSVEQSSKLWSDDYAPEIYRGATPPVKGDLPELNQPKAEDYGAEYAFPNQKKVKYKDRTLYAPKNEELEKKFLEDYKAYDEERLRRKAMWSAPEITPSNDQDTVSRLTLYKDKVPASEVRVGDISFRTNKDGSLKEFFTVTKVVDAEGVKTIIEGHYAGHQTQIKEWESTTEIDVIRGEANPPAAGDKEPLDRPDRNATDYKELEAARQVKIAEADKLYSPSSFASLTEIPSKPDLPVFYGSAEKIFVDKAGDGPAIMDALDNNGFITFDFETVGKNVRNSLNPDAPIQVAAVKYAGGKKVDEINLYINPEQPLGNYYYQKDKNGKLIKDENGNKILREDRLSDTEGKLITDDWLATQPKVKEQFEKLIAFMGDKPLLIAHNATFDVNLLQRWAEKLGLDFSIGGAIDTVQIARVIQAKDKAKITFPSSPKNEDKITIDGGEWEYSSRTKSWKQSNSLQPLAKRLGIKTKVAGTYHDAAYDVDVTQQVLRSLLNRLESKDIFAGRLTEFYDAGFGKWVEAVNTKKEEIRRIETNNLKSGNTTLDEAIKNISEVGNESVKIADDGEVVSSPKPYKSLFTSEIITSDWITNPENTIFIPKARIKDLRLGDFIVGKNGNFQEIVSFNEDDVDPINAVKVVRIDIENNQPLENRDSDRVDGGTGFYFDGPLVGGIYRPIINKEKSSAQINTDAPKPEPVNETPVIIEPVQPVKGEDLNEDQIKTVVSNVINDITSGAKAELTIKEAVKGENIDETIKEQVIGKDRPVTSKHLTEAGVQLKLGDRVLNIKNKKTGRVATIFDKYGKADYPNYVRVKYDDGAKGPVASDSLLIIEAATEGYTPRVIKASDILRPSGKASTKTVQDVSDAIKNIQSQPLAEGVDRPENIPNADELAKIWKDRELERDRIAAELNFVSTSPEIVSSIKALAPAKISTKSFMPSLKTGEPMTITFGFDKPTARELESYAEKLNLSGPDDILVFRATKDFINRKEHLATIKPDGSIVWSGTERKKNSSIDLKNALDSYTNPPTGLQAMFIQPDDDDEPDNSIPPALGKTEDSFDYDLLKVKINPTLEQRAVLDAIMTGKNVVVRALAGTGKTSTLKLAANRILLQKPDAKITYIAFNKSVQKEAAKEFPENTDARTDGSLAYWNIPKDILNKHKSEEDKKKVLRNQPDIAKHLGIEPTTVSVKGTEVTLSSNDIPKLIRQAVTNYTVSEDDKVTIKHFAGMNLDTVPPTFIDYANRMWEDIASPTGLLNVSPSDRNKIWALSKPDFSKGLYGEDGLRKIDTVFFDEAQDINPVMAKILRDQAGNGVQIVYVGDSNQAIYGFRGAIDELDNVKAEYDLPITETFRFGEEIASIANRFLTKIGSKNKVKGLKGKKGEIVDSMSDATAIITRTNGGGISAMLEMLQSEKIVGVDEKTVKDMQKLLKDISWLKRAGGPSGTSVRRDPHDELASFNNWLEVEESVRKGESFGSASYMVNLLKTGRTTKDIEDILNRIEPITDKPVPTEPFKPLTVDNLKNGSSGVLGYKEFTDKRGRTYDQPVAYEVKNNRIEIKNASDFYTLFMDAGFEVEKVNLPEKNKDGSQKFYNIFVKNLDNPSELLPTLNKFKRRASNYPPEKPIEVEIITAHKAKGKQWKRVRIYDDFKAPEISEETGDLVMPEETETRLSYVAVTRAEEALELGSLAWILEVTSEDDGKPNITEAEEIMGMTVTPDPKPVSTEEVGDEVVKGRKITDEKTLEVANRLIALIEKGVVPWTKGWSGGGFLPSNGKTKNTYQGTNVLALWAAMAENNWTDPRFLTFKQGGDLGGFVRKGEKGTKILRPVPHSKEVKQPDGTTKKITWLTFDEANVFNAAQFDNLQLPPLIKKDPVPVSEIETQILKSYKDGHPEIIYRPQDKAFYTPDEDKIYLPLRNQFDSNNAFIETFFHELAHSTGHISRLGKDGKRKDLQDNYKKHYESRGEEELIAEISVALIAAEFGVEIDWGNTAAYADFWLKPLKNDPEMLIIAAKQAQSAVNWMLGIEPGDNQTTPEADTQKPEAGEGVGSEGKTGEQIAEEKPETPDVTPEPNVGQQGQTGEEIAQNTPKNKDTSVKPTKINIQNEEYDLWNDITYDRTSEEGKDNKNINDQHGVFASRILDGQELIADRNEIGKYISDILKKYGYGNKLFYITKPSVAEEILGKDPKKGSGGVEAGVLLADSKNFKEDDPLKNIEFPAVLIRKRGISKVALLHEIAHLMVGSWKNGVGGGHSLIWHQTWLTLLRKEGFQKEANLLASAIGDMEGDTGVINIP